MQREACGNSPKEKQEICTCLGFYHIDGDLDGGTSSGAFRYDGRDFIMTESWKIF